MASVLERLGNSAGDIALRAGLITQEQYDLVQQGRADLKGSLGEILVNMGLVAEKDLYRALAQHLKFPFFDPEKTPPDMSVADRVPADFKQAHAVLPVRWQGNKLAVAFADPTDVEVVDDVRRLTGANIVPLLARPRDIAHYLSREPRSLPRPSLAPAGDLESGFEAAEDVRDVAMQAPVVRLLNTVLREALSVGASDIHIEPDAKEVHVRFRVDGMLYDVMPVSKATMHAPFITRIKVLAEMNIAESRVLQDGHFPIRFQARDYDLRVSTLPTIHGEKAVLRILNRSSVIMGLTQLGMDEATQMEVEQLVAKPQGMALVTGPSGAGKTTTLYSVLHRIFSAQRNFVTVEDPVEFTFPRVNQVQVNPKAGLTFATILRGLLRQDPDVILVGEIRDLETARLAIEAALTGHLVLSTLHTNDAPTTVARLLEMGIEPFLLAACLNGVVAQRLARRVCPQCREPYRPSAASLMVARFTAVAEGEPLFYHSKGCEHCRQTGYRGRIGLFEVLRVNDEVHEIIARRGTALDIRDAARVAGMRFLHDDGYHKAREGITTLEEVIRVVDVGE